MSNLKVEKQALLADAKAWHQASEDLAKPTAAIEPLTLNGADDVTGMGARMGFDASYEKARSKMLEIMDQAAGYFDELAGALIDVGERYEKNDQEYGEKLDRLSRELEDS